MSKLSEIYKQVKPATVAIVSRVSRDPAFPQIIGTGYIVREDGIIFTNQHVINAFKKLPKRKGAPEDEWPALALLFHFIPGKGTVLVPMDIKAVLLPESHEGGVHYGPKVPDIGIIRVDVAGLPTVKIAEKFNLDEGDEIAFCGFPMGTRTLKAPGWIHQITPTLQQGILSAILPMVCDNPHAILIDIQTEGGSSGSPIFNPETGEVVAMLYAGLLEDRIMQGKDGDFLLYKNSTSHTLGVPCQFLSMMLNQLDDLQEFKDDKINYKKLEDLLKEDGEHHLPGQPTMKNTCEIEQ